MQLTKYRVPGLAGQKHAVVKYAVRPAVAGKFSLRSVSVKDEQKVLTSDPSHAGNANGHQSSSAPNGNSAQPQNINDLDILPLMWERNAPVYGDLTALEDPHRGPANIVISHRELAAQMLQLSSGLNTLGLQKGDRVSLFSENSSRWIIADQAVMMNGAVAAVRGSTAPLDELAYIARHSKSIALLLQDVAALEKMSPELLKPDAPSLKFIVLLWGSPEAAAAAVTKLGLPATMKVVTYDEVMELGAAYQAAKGKFQVVASAPSDLATLCYTSGTTGHPKAVMLTHGNLMYQVRNLRYFVPINKGETTLSLLPPWHIYERTSCYFMLSYGLRQVYSSIPKFGADLAKYRPNHFVCVPLVLDTLHSRVMNKLKSSKVAQVLVNASIAFTRNWRVVQGLSLLHSTKESARTFAGLFTAAVSSLLLLPLHLLAGKLVYSKVKEAVGVRDYIICGGGSLAPHLDDFFEALGITLLNGWGLTETSPVLACRRGGVPGQNVRGSTGLPTPGTTLRVVDPETLEPLPDGTKGLILAQGPGVMPGYLEDAESTAKAFRAGPGWFDTGDLGYRVAADVPGSNMAGNFVLTGRAKDTIVLSSGKKIEPEPVENACTSSPLIKNLILLGQDKRELGALVFPDHEALEALNEQRKAAAAAAGGKGGEPLTPAELEELLTAEVTKLNSKRPDYHSFDHIAHISVVMQPLSVEQGTLTRTMKPRRPEIAKIYAKDVEALMARLRG